MASKSTSIVWNFHENVNVDLAKGNLKKRIKKKREHKVKNVSEKGKI